MKEMRVFKNTLYKKHTHVNFIVNAFKNLRFLYTVEFMVSNCFSFSLLL